jgi:hypothetical protein
MSKYEDSFNSFSLDYQTGHMNRSGWAGIYIKKRNPERVTLLFFSSMGPAGFKSEGEIRSPIAIPYAPAHGSGDGGI